MVKLTPKERIEKVVCWARLSTNAFALQIGLSSPQSLYQIKVGKHNISRSIAERICTRYPEIDFGWLFAGEGEMLRPLEKPIPYYTTDCTEIVLYKTLPAPTSYVTMAGCGDCDFVAPFGSRSMEPSIRQGSLLFCKRCELDEVAIGMLVLATNGRVAQVRKVATLSATELILEADAPQTIPTRFDTTQIEKLYIVKALLEWKNI